MITCTFEDGGKASLRHVVVGAIVVNQARDQILLERRSSTMGSGANLITIPGGFLDRGESTSEGVLRELKEETGYLGKIVALFRIKDNPNRRNEDRQNIDFVYLIEVGEKVGEPDQETAEVKWYSLNDLPPENDWAFDHLFDVELYKQYLQKPFPLPYLGKK